MLAKTLIAGPWIGEFGWELFAWQAYIRALSIRFDKTIIISRPNSKALYDDFANKFISYTPPEHLADSFFMYNVDMKTCLYDAIRQNDITLNKNTALFMPRRIGHPPNTHYEENVSLGKCELKPKYICLGHQKEKDYDYIFHIRNRELRKEDNWSLENWQQLREKLGKDKKIGCIGTLKEAAWLKGTEDLRSLELKKICDIMRNSECVFGPSSGPMHLASLCGAPHIVWSTSKNKTRYEENWNPLNTPVLFLDKHGWHPTAEYVVERFSQWFKKNKEKG